MTFRPPLPRPKAEVFELSMPDYDRLYRMVDRVTTAAKHGGLPEEIARLNRIWKEMGDKYGFEWMTARPAPGMSYRYVLALPIRKKGTA